jgi:hypothetical protein
MARIQSALSPNTHRHVQQGSDEGEHDNACSHAAMHVTIHRVTNRNAHHHTSHAAKLQDARHVSVQVNTTTLAAMLQCAAYFK